MNKNTLKKIDFNKIKTAVAEVEKSTSGEIVPVIMSKSDSYPGALWRVAFAFSVVLTYAVYFFFGDMPVFDFVAENPFLYCIILMICFIPVGFLIAQIPTVFSLAITKRELEEEVYQKALEVFHREGVNSTRDRTGVLIFVSLLERRVIVLADVGINAKVPPKTWDLIVEDMIKSIKHGDISQAFTSAISSVGEHLKKSFPIKDDDTNELKNDLVVE